MTKQTIISAVLAAIFCAQAQAEEYKITSPDKRTELTVSTGKQLTYSVKRDGVDILSPSAISMQWKFDDNKQLAPGRDGGKLKAAKSSGKQTIEAPFYMKSQIQSAWNSLRLTSKQYAVEFRVFDSGVAYRFEATASKPFVVEAEQAEFALPGNNTVWMPYANLQMEMKKGEEFECQFRTSFENTYTVKPVAEHDPLRLAFLPVMAEAAQGKKVCITESDLIDYPGMFLNAGQGNTLKGVFAPYPKTTEKGGHNGLQTFVTSRENYIAKSVQKKTFPWRIVAIADNDIDLTNNDMVYQLATPSKLADVSWIKPGKVAWEWWNDLKIYGVDFVAGVNTDTYKYYIDFAAKNGIEYVILDEGWATHGKNDLFSVIPEIDLDGIIEYGKSKNVGIILWAGYNAFAPELEKICKHYSEKGVKGFKVDFMDRDDQEMVNFTWKAAEMCAKYKMVIDLHGMFKPAGIQATYPNVVNFEGVHGLEQMKWAEPSVDQVTYDVTLPYIRQVAGPMDYTQGAMNNATQHTFRSIHSAPMSQGTRCRQLAEYVVFLSPLNMLCDSPNNYEAEPECTQFIAQIPTIWDETKPIDGKVAEYVVIARRKGDTWYIGGMTNWNQRQIELKLDFIADGSKAEIFADGVNAHQVARDYKKTTKTVNKGETLKLDMAPGGGFAIKITK